MSWTKEQKAEYAKKYYEEHKEKYLKASRRYRHSAEGKEVAREYRKTTPFKKANNKRACTARIKRKYGLEPKDFQEMLDVQGNCCAICGDGLIKADTRKDPVVDHNHITGNNRGILCRLCNSLLGYAKDSKEVLSKAVSYLNQYED
jgi:hypothetical protein